MKMGMPQLRIQKEKMGNNLAGFLTYPAEERRVCISNSRVACKKHVAPDERWGVCRAV